VRNWTTNDGDGQRGQLRQKLGEFNASTFVLQKKKRDFRRRSEDIRKLLFNPRANWVETGSMGGSEKLNTCSFHIKNGKGGRQPIDKKEKKKSQRNI